MPIISAEIMKTIDEREIQKKKKKKIKEKKKKTEIKVWELSDFVAHLT